MKRLAYVAIFCGVAVAAIWPHALILTKDGELIDCVTPTKPSPIDGSVSISWVEMRHGRNGYGGCAACDGSTDFGPMPTGGCAGEKEGTEWPGPEPGCPHFVTDAKTLCHDGQWDRVAITFSGCIVTESNLAAIKAGDKKMAEWVSQCN